MAPASGAARLAVRDVNAAEAQLRHDAAQERRGVLQPAQHVHERLVVQPEPGEMLNLLHLGHPVNHLVVARAQKAHEPVLVALDLYARDDFRAALPLAHHPRDELHGVLEVAAHRNHAVARHLRDAVVRRVELAEVPRVENRLYPRVSEAQLADEGARPVGGAVVDEAQLPVVPGARGGKLLLHRLRDGDHVLLLVVARNQDADFPHGAPFVRTPGRRRSGSCSPARSSAPRRISATGAPSPGRSP